ncbi:MAG: cob(I)yrinic acid a,c-diamide adenosyltransferase [Muribaculaceae bacterium]|nr:cob(I)yrinic acid a,c-diamide adenosyltransferase [Muribaculaceae bacterium]
MTKSALYTRTGDSGTTSLVGGARAAKDCPRLEAYGTVDEFSSFLGVVLSMPDCPEDIRSQLLEVQNMLFNVGGYLACEVKEGECPPVWVLCAKDIAALEGWIDSLDELTPKVNAFVLPGGCLLAAHAHVARAVCRRAERRIIALSALEYVDPILIKYINRLSDYLFILARYFNHQAGVEEITWKQEKK